MVAETQVGNILDDVVASARQLTESDVVQLHQDLKQTELKATQLETLAKNLSPLEKPSQSKKVLSSKDKILQDLKDLRGKIAFAEKPFPILDASVLGWRDNKGFPKLIVFDFDGDGSFAITSNGEMTSLPEKIKTAYQDVATNLGKLRGRSWRRASYATLGLTIIMVTIIVMATSLLWLIPSVILGIVGIILLAKADFYPTIQIEAQWSHLIPTEIHQKIAEVRDDFEKILFLTEAPKWQISGVPRPQPLPQDPLVLGWVNHELYYIAKFDATALENFVASECTEQ